MGRIPVEIGLDDWIGGVWSIDCREGMRQLPPDCIDLIVTDPPYSSKIAEWDYKDDKFHFEWLEEAHRVLKPSGAIYVCFAPLNSYGVEGFIRDKFTLKNKIAWWHRNLYGANLSYGKDRFKSTYEQVFYAVKGERSYIENVNQRLYQRYGSSFDVIDIPAILRNRLHKAQKPEALFERFVYATSNEGDVVLDPFVGVGTLPVVCIKLGRRFIGFDNEKEFVEKAEKRIDDERRTVGGLFGKKEK